MLEPVGALPVIIEDDVVGGNCGTLGAIVKVAPSWPRASSARSTPIYDLPNERIIEAAPGQPLIVPEGAIVVPDAPRDLGKGREWGCRWRRRSS
jgi:2,3,4,5-tetrahydropyridine-2-carboxylate N-succinyltransferase